MPVTLYPNSRKCVFCNSSKLTSGEPSLWYGMTLFIVIVFRFFFADVIVFFSSVLTLYILYLKTVSKLPHTVLHDP